MFLGKDSLATMSTSTCYCRNLGQKVVGKLCVPDTERHRVSATIVTALSQLSILFFPAFPSIAHSSTFSLPLFLLPCYFSLAEHCHWVFSLLAFMEDFVAPRIVKSLVGPERELYKVLRAPTWLYRVPNNYCPLITKPKVSI